MGLFIMMLASVFIALANRCSRVEELRRSAEFFDRLDIAARKRIAENRVRNGCYGDEQEQ